VTGIAAGFRSIDREADAGRFVAYLDAQSSNWFWQLRKRESIDALRLRPGDRGLDVGCGLGDEVRTMAAEVGDDGLAFGVDASRTLLLEARRRTEAGMHAFFSLADAHTLPFPDGTFSGVRAERTLQHVSEPGGVLADMARVLEPGGRLAAIEPDWDTLVIDAEPLDLTRMFCRGWTEGVRHPNIGRELVGLLSHAGLTKIEVWPVTWLIPSFEVADQQFSISEMAEAVVEREWATAEDAARWFDDVHEREDHREFFAAVTYFFVTALKPDEASALS
jgi:ubiquinone/menaquinone biosynthesis C-methylase UbiE